MSKYLDIDREDALTCVGKGWASLVNELYDKKPKKIKVVQLKEKFASLRCYTDWSDDEFDKVIEDVERRSETICEQCGSVGKVRDIGHWLVTLCDDCEIKRKENNQ